MVISVVVNQEKIDRLKEVWINESPEKAKELCNNIAEMLAVEEISYDFYRGSAQALVREMDGNQDFYYMEEKLRQLLEMFVIAYKHTPDGPRFLNALRELKKLP